MACKVYRFRLHAAALAFLCLAAAAGAVPHYVRPPGTCTNTELQSPYDTWDTAATQIQWAVNAAAYTETVWVTNGAYFLTNQVSITSNITLRSVSGWTNTLVAADWPNYTTRVFYLANTATVDGFTISNGHAWGADPLCKGGGVYMISSAQLKNCYLLHNTSSNSATSAAGAGIFTQGYNIISNCIIFSNTCLGSVYGGGIYASSRPKILQCTIVSNRSRSGVGGGGIWGNGYDASNCTFAFNWPDGAYAENGMLVDCLISNNYGIGVLPGNRTGVARDSTIVNNSGGGVNLSFGGGISNCVVANNRSSGAGAGIVFSVGQYTNSCSWAENCWISNNVSQANAGGGGVYITNRGWMQNCIINNNTNLASGGVGGGILAGNASGRQDLRYGIINCTIVNNYSTNEGGGVALYGESNFFINCIMAGNTSSSGNYPNVFFRDNAALNKYNFSNCCAVTTDAYYLAEDQGNITNAPVYSGSYPWRPAPNSPCLNRGLNQAWMLNAIDLSGGPRIRYGAVDIGALEGIYDCALFTIH